MSPDTSLGGAWYSPDNHQIIHTACFFLFPFLSCPLFLILNSLSIFLFHTHTYTYSITSDTLWPSCSVGAWVCLLDERRSPHHHGSLGPNTTSIFFNRAKVNRYNFSRCREWHSQDKRDKILQSGGRWHGPNSNYYTSQNTSTSSSTPTLTLQMPT